MMDTKYSTPPETQRTSMHVSRHTHTQSYTYTYTSAVDWKDTFLIEGYTYNIDNI